MSIFIENKLLTKLLETNDLNTLHKNNIKKSHFQFNGEVYQFVLDYFYTHKSLPDVSTVIENFDNFEIQDTADKLEYLCLALKDSTAKKLSYELLQNQVSEKFTNLTGNQFITWLKGEVEHIIDITGVQSMPGSDYSTNEDERMERYNTIKLHGANTIIPYPYQQLNKWLMGGSELGDYVLLMAHSGIGKSWICSHIALYQWEQGFGILHYSPELTKQQVESRLDTLRFKVENSGLRDASLTDEKRYLKALEESKSKTKAPYIIKTMEDMLEGLTLELIEADILANPGIQVVVIDGFNLISHATRENNTRNNMTITSRKLRQMFSKFQVLGIITHQAKGSSMTNTTDVTEKGKRVLKAPELSDYSETIAVIQDASTVLTFQANDGIGLLHLAKSRSPFKDKSLDMIVDFNRGFINAVDLGSVLKC